MLHDPRNDHQTGEMRDTAKTKSDIRVRYHKCLLSEWESAPRSQWQPMNRHRLATGHTNGITEPGQEQHSIERYRVSQDIKRATYPAAARECIMTDQVPVQRNCLKLKTTVRRTEPTVLVKAREPLAAVWFVHHMYQ